MKRRDEISEEIQYAWAKLNARWQGEDADAFHREYIAKLSELAASFACACQQLESASSELQEVLTSIEQRITNQ